jgi:hypothetical protein
MHLFYSIVFTCLILKQVNGNVSKGSPKSVNNINNNNNNNNNKNQFCSRQHSKVVREYFARVLLPIFKKYSQPVPDKCPFSPFHDIYHYQENNKTKLDVNKWKCEMCGKMFQSESYLDNHFNNRHNNTLQIKKSANCLANFCRIFRCDVLMKRTSSSTKCYESTLTKLRDRCKIYVDQCIPDGLSHNVKSSLKCKNKKQ